LSTRKLPPSLGRALESWQTSSSSASSCCSCRNILIRQTLGSNLRFIDLALVEVELILHLLTQVFLLTLRAVLEFDHLVDLLANLTVGVFKLVCLIRQLVHVVQQRVVLLLRLDERSHDFFNSRDTCGLLDLLKGILNYFHIAQVLVHEPLLLAVGGYEFS